ncbi:MAG: ATP-binding protein [Microbacteriaceae bacterium]
MHGKLFVERWNTISLRTKVTGVSVLLLTIGLLVAGLGSMSVLRGFLVQNIDQRLASARTAITSQQYTLTSDGCIPGSEVPTDYTLSFYDEDGEFLCSTSDSGPDIARVTLAFAEAHSTPFTVTTGSQQWRVATGTFYINGTDTQVSAVVALDLDDTEDLLAKFAAIFLFFGLTVVVFGGALTGLLVTSAFSPLRDVEATAARFAAGDFGQRLGGATPNTEVGRLNRSLNSMLNRIDRAFADRARTIEQMRRFVGDASHELRTPLVSLRGYAELYRMGALPTEEAVAQAMERIEKEAIRMGALVEDLLELARIDETKPLKLGDVDLVALARDAALDTMASAPGRAVTVLLRPGSTTEPATTASAAVPPGAAADAAQPSRALGSALSRLRPRRSRPVAPAAGTAPALPVLPAAPTGAVVIVAEEAKVRQVITNLMGNAVRYTPDGTPIEIEIGADAAAGVATVAVVDHGEGIPPQIREKIFQRFWRADTSRNRDTGGTGLGLAIVASIVGAHHGRIDVLETPGGGATFRVTLPLLQGSTPAEPSPAG